MSVATDQWMAALAIANEVREKRKHLKADLRAGRVLLADAFFSDAPWLRTMKIRDLLLATPGVWEVKANRALRVCRINQMATLSGTPRERLVDLLGWVDSNHPAVKVGRDVAHRPIPREQGQVAA